MEGEIIEKTGFANYNPQFSPDGKKISYLSNQDFDYGTTGLFIYDISKKKTREYISSGFYKLFLVSRRKENPFCKKEFSSDYSSFDSF
ncbi:MAG: PD40 domain-containing protein [Ignavibacteria bacterium]|nr:PD40 domain-containing protein [Ignavibacteria bacterium]